MRSERRAGLACSIALFAASFLARYPLARTWSSLRVLDQHDVLFDADPVVFLHAFRDGEMRIRFWRTHPNVRNLVNPPVRLVAGAVTLACPEWTAQRARGEVALLVAPLASAVTTVAVFLTLRLLGGSLGAAALGAVLEMLSFSGLVFGSIPESYPLSGALLAMAFLLLADATRPGGRLRPLPWILTGSAATGIVTTNLGLVGILLFISAARVLRSRARAAAASVALMLAAAALAALTLLVVNAAYGERVILRHLETKNDPFLRPHPLETARSFPEALVSSVLPAKPALVTSEIEVHRDYPIKVMFTIEGSGGLVSRLLRSLVIAGFLLLGALELARRTGPGPPLLLAAGFVLVFNLVLHAIYRGPDLLLYSMHWHAAMALVLGAGALSRRRGLVALLAAAVAGNSLMVVLWMVRTLHGVG